MDGIRRCMRSAAVAVCGMWLVVGARLSLGQSERAFGQGQAAAAQSQPADATGALAETLGSMQGVERVEMRFVCQKRLVNLDVPLESGGRMWVGRGAGGAVRDAADAKDGAVGQAVAQSEAVAGLRLVEGMRMATQWPYGSDIIWAEGKVKTRSQHETEWTITSQAARPGLTAVMVQVGRWATGEAETGGMFEVHWAMAVVPPAPGGDAGTGRAMRVFELTPTNKDLAISVQQVTLAFEPAGPGAEGMQLSYVEIVTAQGDRTRYWFFEQQRDGAWPRDVFSPEAVARGVP